MEGFQVPTPFARLAAQALRDRYFTLLDIGCSSGLDAVWRVFGDRLRAFAFDPNVDEVARLTAKETLPGVAYVAAFVGLPSDDPGAARLSTGDFWGRMPWNRLSVPRTLQLQAEATAKLGGEEKTKLNLWGQVPLADPKEPVIIPSFLSERGVDDVDFIKIDVDGADFLILRSLVSLLSDKKVLGVGIEVNFHGSDDPDVHALHNVDRLMKKCGFELFSLSSRPYSMAALPAPYQLTIPAQSTWGRLLQGDALYVRDVAAPEQQQWAESTGASKLLKVAALFSLAGLPDCGAEVLVRYRDLLEPVIDVQAGLDALTLQCIPDGEPPLTYAEYIAEFEADGDRFWPARKVDTEATRAVLPEPDAEETETTSAVLLPEPEAQDSDTSAILKQLNQEIEALKSSKSWRVTAPLRELAGRLKRVLGYR